MPKFPNYKATPSAVGIRYGDYLDGRASLYSAASSVLRFRFPPLSLASTGARNLPV
jgi:hypothetical protein